MGLAVFRAEAVESVVAAGMAEELDTTHGWVCRGCVGFARCALRKKHIYSMMFHRWPQDADAPRSRSGTVSHCVHFGQTMPLTAAPTRYECCVRAMDHLREVYPASHRVRLRLSDGEMILGTYSYVCNSCLDL